MRIDRLDLIAYGPFTDKSLDLSDGAIRSASDLRGQRSRQKHILRALIAWLFGIPNPYQRQLSSRESSASDRRETKAVRWQRNWNLSGGRAQKGTLLGYSTGESLDDSVLAPFLPGGIDENLFTKLYGINHDQIGGGRKRAADQSGDLGQALFSAAIGTASLREILSDLQNGAEELFKPRASNKIREPGDFEFQRCQKENQGFEPAGFRMEKAAKRPG